MEMHEEIESKIAEAVKALKEAEQAVRQLEEFTALLYDAIEQIVASFVKRGVEQLTTPERTKHSNGQESLCLSFRGVQIVLISSKVAAYLAPDDPNFQKYLETVQKVPVRASRLLVLLRPDDDKSPAVVFGAFYIFRDGSLCTSKLGSTFSNHKSFDSDVAMNFAFSLVKVLIEAPSYWQEPEQVAYESIYGDIQRPSIGFRPPEKDSD